MNHAEARQYVRKMMVQVLEAQTSTSAHGRQALRDEEAVQKVWSDEVMKCIERIGRPDRPRGKPVI